MMLSERYDRNIRLFGEEGQQKLHDTTVALIGVGGLGSPVAQHLALLGVGNITLIDDEELDESNRNRFIGARHNDRVPGSPKVELAERLIHEINPEIRVTALKVGLVTTKAFDVIKTADWIFGCFDEDGPRFILNELCAAYTKPYIDLASDVAKTGEYGGRVCVAQNGDGCLSCLDQLDSEDVRHYLSTEEERATEAATYGIPHSALGETGPSVSPVNGVVASLAVTEFMLAVTGMAEPRRLINYTGHLPRITTAKAPTTDCYYCKSIRGTDAAADVERYLRMPHLQTGRAQ